MNKSFLCKIPISLFFLVTIRLFAMPDAVEMPTAAPAQTAEVSSVQPAAPTPAAAMPDQPVAPQPAGDAAQSPAATPQASPQAATPTEEVKSEKLGEFELNENQPEIIKDKDSKIRSLVNKSNELSRQINDNTNKIKEIYDNAFNKFSEINNSLDEFYRKVGFESGRAKELLKEQK